MRHDQSQEDSSDWIVNVRLGFDNTIRRNNAENDIHNAALCTQCQKIDFDTAFSLDISNVEVMGTDICTFDGLCTAAINTACLLCRGLMSLLKSSISDLDHQRRYSGRILAFPTSSITGSNGYNLEETPIICGLALGSGALSWDAQLRRVSGLWALILPLDRETPSTTGKYRVTKLRKIFDYKRVREMLLHCARSHNLCRRPSQNFPVNERVINCTARRLVPMTEECRYMALSYVWGASSSDDIIAQVESEVLNDGILPNPLPHTIEDAINATQSLGIRYMWVDRYCIEQHHSADKLHQISQMANIYNRAVATLVALGSHDNVGLPGVTERPEPFHIFHMRRSRYTFVPAPGLQQSLQQSVWSTRGWTFQEAMLSRRCIFSRETKFT